MVAGGYGEQNTPGYQPSGGTQKCNAIFAAAGKTGVYQQPDGYGGVACNYLWFVQAMLNHATSLQPSALATAMHSIGTHYLLISVRTDQLFRSACRVGLRRELLACPSYQASCKCYQMQDPTFNKPFP